MKVAILLSLDAGFISYYRGTAGKVIIVSQSYFHWMRVSYQLKRISQQAEKVCRNPTFTGCGFHIHY